VDEQRRIDGGWPERELVGVPPHEPTDPLGPGVSEHPRGRVDPRDLEPPFGHRLGDPSGPDPDLQSGDDVAFVELRRDGVEGPLIERRAGRIVDGGDLGERVHDVRFGHTCGHPSPVFREPGVGGRSVMPDPTRGLPRVP
jgi:hypothetical protein